VPQQDHEPSNQRGALMALGVVVLLFVIGLLLTRALYSSGRLEDCLMSGRTNCEPLQTPSR
jgi:hypothetical protein